MRSCCDETTEIRQKATKVIPIPSQRSSKGWIARRLLCVERDHRKLGSNPPPRRMANFSDHFTLPVACMTTNKVITEIIVIARPVNPFQKNACEKITR